MAIPERFSNLPDYAFPRLRALLAGIEPGGEPTVMTIGEPRHALPDFTGPILAAQMGFLPGTIWILVGVMLAAAPPKAWLARNRTSTKTSVRPSRQTKSSSPPRQR